MDIKKYLRPTGIHISLLVLVFILIGASTYVNLKHMPPMGNFFCSIMELGQEQRDYAEEGKQLRLENNVDPNKIIELYQKIDIIAHKHRNISKNIAYDHTTPSFLGNMYFYGSKMPALNPFFPTPCEYEGVSREFSIFYSEKQCRYYQHEEDFECTTSYYDQLNRPGAFLSFDIVKEYKKINMFSLIINSILLLAVFYLLVSLIYYLTLKMKHVLAIIGLIIAIIFIAFLTKLYFLLLMIFVVIYAVIQEKKITLIVINIIIIFVLVIGLVLAKNYLAASMSRSGSYKIGEEKYFDILNCNNTKILNMTEKREDFSYFDDEEILNEEWQICYNPECRDLCEDHCEKIYGFIDSSGIPLRGDTPSCVCTCLSRDK